MVQAFDWVEENFFEELNFFWKVITPSLQRQRIFNTLKAVRASGPAAIIIVPNCNLPSCFGLCMTVHILEFKGFGVGR